MNEKLVIVGAGIGGLSVIKEISESALRVEDLDITVLQRILADQPINLTAEDRRALSPLFWTHVRPYGTFELHLDRHLDLLGRATPRRREPVSGGHATQTWARAKATS